MQKILNRKTTRLKQYDYCLPGAYFISICTQNRRTRFGEIVNERMVLNGAGRKADEEWQKTFFLRPYLRIDEYVIMPNHFHAILWISDYTEGTARRAPTNEFSKPFKGSLSSIVRSYKAAVTKHVNEVQNTRGDQVWQRGFYEHVIRKDESLEKIRQYIVDNPINWSTDPDNSSAIKGD